MERMVNKQVVFLFVILLALSIGCAIGSLFRNHLHGSQMWYLLLGNDSSATTFILDILTFIILYQVCDSTLHPSSAVSYSGHLAQNLVPISCVSKETSPKCEANS